MPFPELTRRDFTLLTGTLAATALPLGAATPTAGDVIKQLQTKLGGDWPATGPDGLKARSGLSEYRYDAL